MTTEEKAKAYDEAFERAKQIRNGNPSSGTAIVVCEEIFPELRESEDEDEKIRKELISHFEAIKLVNNQDMFHGFKIDNILSYLEKQKELMPPVNVDPCDASWDAYYQRGLNKGYELGLEAGRKEQKPNIEICPHSIKSKSYKVQKPVEWSEEDEKMLIQVFESIRYADDHYEFDGKEVSSTDVKAWLLKSLRPCPSWKPSNEQMEALNKARRFIPYNCDILESLYEQLKQL